MQLFLIYMKRKVYTVIIEENNVLRQNYIMSIRTFNVNVISKAVGKVIRVSWFVLVHFICLYVYAFCNLYVSASLILT
jgi:uncharacterized membrane protein